jgi:hypothetical protein
VYDPDELDLLAINVRLGHQASGGGRARRRKPRRGAV